MELRLDVDLEAIPDIPPNVAALLQLQLVERPQGLAALERWVSAMTPFDGISPGALSVLSVLVRPDLGPRLAIQMRPGVVTATGRRRPPVGAIQPAGPPPEPAAPLPEPVPAAPGRPAYPLAVGPTSMTVAVAPPGGPTVPLVRQQVRDVLQQSPTFRALPEAQRRQLAHDMVNVGQYLADAGGATVRAAAGGGDQPGAVARAAPSRGLGRPSRPSDTAGQKFGAQGGAVAAAAGADALANLVATVDFPDLRRRAHPGRVPRHRRRLHPADGGLRRAGEERLQERRRVHAGQRHRKPGPRLPGRPLPRPPRGRHHRQSSPRWCRRPDANESNMPDFFKDLGLAMPVDSLDEDTTEEVLVPAARQQMAIDRQRMLLMMVMMGINRLVVTDGSIKAAVIFQLNTTDLVQQPLHAPPALTRPRRRKSRSGVFSGWFSPTLEDRDGDEAQRDHHPTDESEAVGRAEGEADRRCERTVQERGVPAEGHDHLARAAGARAPDDAAAAGARQATAPASGWSRTCSPRPGRRSGRRWLARAERAPGPAGRRVTRSVSSSRRLVGPDARRHRRPTLEALAGLYLTAELEQAGCSPPRSSW